MSRNLTKQSGGAVNKETFKNNLTKRCMANLKTKRKEKLSNIRATNIKENTPLPDELNLEQIIRLELEAMQKEDQEISAGLLSELDHLNLITTMEDYLIDSQFEDVSQFDENQYWDSLQESYVPCIKCKKYKLELCRNVFYCRCGFKMNAKDRIKTLEQFRTEVQNVLNNHSASCDQQGDFVTGHSNRGERIVTFLCYHCGYVHVL